MKRYPPDTTHEKPVTGEQISKGGLFLKEKSMIFISQFINSGKNSAFGEPAHFCVKQ